MDHVRNLFIPLKVLSYSNSSSGGKEAKIVVEFYGEIAHSQRDKCPTKWH
jgi:hypothetical protein